METNLSPGRRVVNEDDCIQLKALASRRVHRSKPCSHKLIIDAYTRSVRASSDAPSQVHLSGGAEDHPAAERT